PGEARKLLRESIAVNEELGDRGGRAASLHQLAIIEQAQGNPGEARKLWEESIAIARQIGDLDGVATSLVMLAQLNVAEGRFEEAVAQGQEALRLLEAIGSSKAAMAREIVTQIEAIATGTPEAGDSMKSFEALMSMPSAEALQRIEHDVEIARASG